MGGSYPETDLREGQDLCNGHVIEESAHQTVALLGGQGGRDTWQVCRGNRHGEVQELPDLALVYMGVTAVRSLGDMVLGGACTVER